MNDGRFVGAALKPDAPTTINYKHWPGAFVPPFHFQGKYPGFEPIVLAPPVAITQRAMTARTAQLAADVQQLSFLQQAPFNQCTPILCSAFYVEDIPYYWKAGICEKVSPAAADSAAASNKERLEH